MKPFLKWAGGKYRILSQIKAALPEANRLIEPFAGSGAVFLNTNYPKNLVADSNADLINTFQHVKHGGNEFIKYCKRLFVPKNNSEDSFYNLREEFNATNDRKRKAALFIYLNRHCFNGLCRYNSSGQFNVPFGRYKNPMFPEESLAFFHKKSRLAQFHVSDFYSTLQKAKKGDVVYCDPPYIPLTETANFTGYTQGGFDLTDQEELARHAVRLAKNGITVVISNHDTPFARRLYRDAEIIAFEVQRFISRDADNRKKAGELIAIFGGHGNDRVPKTQ